jgi:glyoxylase-like metal-dependent hydrolase (beta-lactamase superfamily II)
VDIVRLPAFNPGPYTGDGTNTYLVCGRQPLLVEAGVGDPRHLEAIAAALGGRPLARVVVTHHHADHVAGIGAVAARWPGAWLAKRPWPERDAADPVRWMALADGDELPAGDGRLTVVATPGHAPDHLCLFDPASRTLFGGDLLVREGTVTIPASRGGSLVDYLASLERVAALAPVRVLPAHGPVIDDPCALVARYLAHRRDREAQIVQAIARAPRDLEAVVAEVYRGVPAALVGAARETALAHLRKLEAEGRAARDAAGRWRLAQSA